MPLVEVMLPLLYSGDPETDDGACVIVLFTWEERLPLVGVTETPVINGGDVEVPLCLSDGYGCTVEVELKLLDCGLLFIRPGWAMDVALEADNDERGGLDPVGIGP